MVGPTNEAGLVNAIRKAIKREHPTVWIIKTHGDPMQEAGLPDLLLCVDGLLVGIEVKFQRPRESEQHARERATPGQRVQIQRIIRAGGMAGVVISVEEALDLIRRARVRQGQTGAASTPPPT